MMLCMKRIHFLLMLASLLLLPLAASAQTSNAKPADPDPAAKKLCETVSMITGVAIPPVTGIRDFGLRAAWAWLKSLFGGQTAAA
jgi:hypothetical protein